MDSFREKEIMRLGENCAKVSDNTMSLLMLIISDWQKYARHLQMGMSDHIREAVACSQKRVVPKDIKPSRLAHYQDLL